MGGDWPAEEGYSRSTQTFVRGVIGVDVDGRLISPGAPGFVSVYGTFSPDREGRPELARDVGVIIGVTGVPDDAPLRTWLKDLENRKALVELELRRADEPPIVCQVRVSGQAHPDGKGTLVFSAWVVGDTRFEVARALGLQP